MCEQDIHKTSRKYCIKIEKNNVQRTKIMGGELIELNMSFTSLHYKKSKILFHNG
jgi:predicted DNA-binding helix-hairpin-helix protein